MECLMESYQLTSLILQIVISLMTFAHASDFNGEGIDASNLGEAEAISERSGPLCLCRCTYQNGSTLLNAFHRQITRDESSLDEATVHYARTCFGNTQWLGVSGRWSSLYHKVVNSFDISLI